MSEKLTRLAAIAHQATTYSELPNLLTALETVGHHLEHEAGEDATTARRLVRMVVELDPGLSEDETRALCHAIAALLERPGLKAENERLRDEPTLDGDDAAAALGAEKELAHAG